MKVIGIGRSRSARALWAVEEAGIDYEYQQLNPRRDLGSDWFGALNPGRKVPVLVDGDFVLTESAAIATYVGERGSVTGLVPPERTPERARYDEWLFFVVTELEQPLWSLAKHRFVLPKQHRIPQMAKTAEYEFTRAARTCGAQLGERMYVVGDRFTMADLMLTQTLMWGATLVTDERLVAYRDRHLARPALARVMAAESASSSDAGGAD